MKLCWARNARTRPTFIEIIDILLPDLDDERFDQVSFYHTVHKPLLEAQKEERQQMQQSLNEPGQEMQPMLSSEHSHLHTHPHLTMGSSHAHILEVHPHLQRLFDKNSKFRYIADYIQTGNETADSSALSGTTTVTTGGGEGMSSENSAGDSTQPIQFEEAETPSSHIVRYFPTRINGSRANVITKERGDTNSGETSSDVYVFTEPVDTGRSNSAPDMEANPVKDKTETAEPESGLGSSTILNWPTPTAKCSDRVGDSSKSQLRARFMDQIEQPGEREKTDSFSSSTLSNGSVTALHQHRS